MLCLCTALAKQTLEEKSGQASLVVLFSANRTLLHPRGCISELARFLMMKRESTRCLVLASLIRIAFIPSYSPVALQHGLSCESALRFQELSLGRLDNLFLPSTDMFSHAGFRRINIKSAKVFNQLHMAVATIEGIRRQQG